MESCKFENENMPMRQDAKKYGFLVHYMLEFLLKISTILQVIERNTAKQPEKHCKAGRGILKMN